MIAWHLRRIGVARRSTFSFPNVWLALYVLMGLTAFRANAADLWESKWLEVRTPNFVIYSEISKEKTETLATDLENFRIAAGMFTNIGRLDARIPTKIIVLEDPAHELGFSRGLAGYFRPGMRENFAVMADSGSFSDEVLKHEYVHFLVRNRDGQNYPRWFDEGFAELLSTLTVDGTEIEIGKFSRNRMQALAYLPWLPMEKVLETRSVFSLEQEAGAVFYAQSVLLVHFLMFGRPETDFLQQALEHHRLIAALTPQLAAFETAFGLKAQDLNDRLRRYGRREATYVRLHLKEPYVAAAVATRTMQPDEVAAQLGHLALVIGNYEAAAEFSNAALALNENNVTALIDKADLHKFAKRFDEAKPLYERAIELAPDNANAKLDYAEYFLDLAAQSSETETRQNYLVEARRYLARSYALDQSNPETLAMNGQSYLLGGEPAKAVEFLEHAHDLLPSEFNIRTLLAEAYVRNQDKENAKKQLQWVLAASHTDIVDLEKLLAELNKENEANTGAGSRASAEEDAEQTRD